MECRRCGGPLEQPTTSGPVRCSYCGALAHLGDKATDAPRGRPRRAWLILVGALAILGVGGALWWNYPFQQVPEHGASNSASRAKATALAPVSRPRAAPPKPVVKQTPKRPPRPRQNSTPIRVAADGTIGRNDAKRVLEPELLKCMDRGKIHYLVTSLGQGYETSGTGPLGPLKSINASYVDYLKTPAETFAASPLGQCVLKAAERVKTRAVKGAYIHFTVRNPDIPDPLADAPQRLDANATSLALSDLDIQGRECAVQHPEHAPSGSNTSINLQFRGVDGSVELVKVLYLDAKSPYVQCIVDAYGQAQTTPFRSLTARVMHTLDP